MPPALCFESCIVEANIRSNVARGYELSHQSESLSAQPIQLTPTIPRLATVHSLDLRYDDTCLFLKDVLGVITQQNCDGIQANGSVWNWIDVGCDTLTV